jgi:hypothetical protein
MTVTRIHTDSLVPLLQSTANPQETSSQRQYVFGLHFYLLVSKKPALIKYRDHATTCSGNLLNLELFPLEFQIGLEGLK